MDYHVIAPNAHLVQAWLARKEWEPMALRCVETTPGVTRVGGEVFDVSDLDAVIARLDTLFSAVEPPAQVSSGHDEGPSPA